MTTNKMDTEKVSNLTDAFIKSLKGCNKGEAISVCLSTLFETIEVHCEKKRDVLTTGLGVVKVVSNHVLDMVGKNIVGLSKEEMEKLQQTEEDAEAIRRLQKIDGITEKMQKITETIENK